MYSFSFMNLLLLLGFILRNIVFPKYANISNPHFKLNYQPLYNLFPTFLLTGIAGFIIFDLDVKKIIKIRNYYQFQNIPLSFIRFFTLTTHLFLIILPIYILYFLKFQKKKYIKNNLRYLLPIALFLVYRMIIYPETPENMYRIDTFTLIN